MCYLIFQNIHEITWWQKFAGFLQKNSSSNIKYLEEKTRDLFVCVRKENLYSPRNCSRTLFKSGCKFAANRQGIDAKCRFMRLAYLYVVNRNNQSRLTRAKPKLNYGNVLVFLQAAPRATNFSKIKIQRGKPMREM